MTKDQVHTKLPKPPTEPFDAPEVKRRLARLFLVPDGIVFSGHARKRMADHDMDAEDALTVLRSGAVWDHYRECAAGTWRYCMGTRRFRVMFLFRTADAVVVTAIRLEPNKS